jgi:release factor glutamine methyltransferase
LNELKELKKIPSNTFEKAKEILTKVKDSGMPLQYAMGSTNFYGYDFKVNENVLIPRFDTEVLAEKVINLAKNYDNPQILELCTGSGAVAITVKLNTDAVVVATDISANALIVARENSEKLNAEVEFIEGDLFSAVAGRKFDIIVANPPYIPTKDIETLDKEVKDFEPMLALDGGEDGLDFYRKIALEYKDYLNEGGVVALEVGIGEAQAVSEFFDGEIEMIKDYNEPRIDRVVVIK